MSVTIPTRSAVFSSLLRADFTTQWRNRKASLLVIIVPVVILISWKNMIDKIGGAFVLANSITVGVTAIGIMGYSNSIARDRDKGIFQRLRVAPVPGWSIMMSRLVVQLAMIILMTTAVFAAGRYFDGITLSSTGYALTFLTAIVGGSVFLALGQAIVGLITNPETVNSTSRLVYISLIMIGMFGILGVLGHDFGEVVKWSPYGTVQRMLSASLQTGWDKEASVALLVTLGYTAVFTILGIKKFKWNSR
jgi:ABC-2 type transport system permease protein